MLSRERRSERYKLFYIWKSIYGHVPSLGFKIRWDQRKGNQIMENRIEANSANIRNLKIKSIFGHGPTLFNSLPRSIRDISKSFEEFKRMTDIFLSLIPDQPILKGYISHNYDNNQRQTNSIIYWIKNLKLTHWNNEKTTIVNGDED